MHQSLNLEELGSREKPAAGVRIRERSKENDKL